MPPDSSRSLRAVFHGDCWRDLRCAGIGVARNDDRTSMRRPPAYILPILLLAVIGKLSDRPLIRVAAICIILAIVAVVAWRPLWRLTIVWRSRWPSLHWLPWSLGAVIVIGACAGPLLTQPRLRETYMPEDFAHAPEITSSRGFFPTQTDEHGARYVWTQDRATIVFDFLVHRPLDVTFTVRSAAVAGGPDAPVHVEVNGVEVGQLHPDPTNPNFQPITLRFVPYNWGGRQTEVKLLPSTFAPGKGDPRTLGTMVQSITIDKSASWSAISRRLGLVWMLPVLAIAGTLLALAARRGQGAWANYAAIVLWTLGAGIALVLVVLIVRIGFIARTTYLTWTIGSILIGVCFVYGALALPFGSQEAPNLRKRIQIWLASLPGMSAGVARLRGFAERSDTSTVRQDTHRDLLRDIVLVFFIALGVRLLWVVIIPPWLAPDEPDHYVYTSHIVDQGQIPHPPYPNYPSYPQEFTESATLTRVTELDPVLSGRPESTLAHFPVAYDYDPARTYAGPTADRLTSAGGRASPYPPLYYLLDAIPYALFKHAPVLSRLYAARSGSALLGAFSCVFAYLLAYEVRRSRRWGWAPALCMAFLPMYVFDTATTNNDAAMNCFSTLLIWLAVRVYMRPTLTLRLAFAVGIASAMVMLTKPTALSVVVVAGVVMLIKIVPRVGAGWQRVRPALAPGSVYAMGVCALYGPWLVFRLYYYHAIGLGVIPIAPVVRFLTGISRVDAAPVDTATAHQTVLTAGYSVWSYLRYEADKGPEYFHWLLIKTFWGYFGWLHLPLPAWVYVPIGVFYVIGLIGLGIQLVLQPERRSVLWLLCSFVLAHFFFLFYVVNYNVYRATGSDASFGLQGRYFFPILAPLLLLLLSGWDHLCRERPFALRLAPAAMLALQLIALATLLSHYYGVTIG